MTSDHPAKPDVTEKAEPASDQNTNTPVPDAESSNVCVEDPQPEKQKPRFSLRPSVTRVDRKSFEQSQRPTTRRRNATGLVVTDLLKLRIALDQTEDLPQACQVLAEKLANIFNCSNVFVSVFRRKQLWLFGSERDETFGFDDDAIISAQREVSLDHPATGWPRTEYWNPSIVHRNLTNAHHTAAVSYLMKNPNGSPFGVVTLVSEKDSCVAASEKIDHLIDLVVPHLKLRRQASLGALARIGESLKSKFDSGLKCTLMICLVIAFFFVRIPHRIQCDTEVVPVMRRYVSAPFDSVLKSNSVRTGDFVNRDDELAMLDEDEIRLQRYSVEAEKEKYRKQKSAALAKGDTVKMQQAQLEFRRLSYKNDLLVQRSTNLEVTSPITGVVLKNNLEDAEGAPLSQGQVLFEIAPLDQMTFCVYISQQDIAYVKKGMIVNVTVEAARHTFTGKISRIRPEAVTFENESVFVAEVEFDNQRAIIRPGMRGYATVISDDQSIGWILFRKPYGYLKRITGF